MFNVYESCWKPNELSTAGFGSYLRNLFHLMTPPEISPEAFLKFLGFFLFRKIDLAALDTNFIFLANDFKNQAIANPREKNYMRWDFVQQLPD